MRLPTEPYLDQSQRWPQTRPAHPGALRRRLDRRLPGLSARDRPLRRYAAAHQRFGGEFSFARMSWIKTKFLWMMYRSG